MRSSGENKVVQWKIGLMAAAWLLLMLLFVVRMYFLQIVDGQELKDLALSQTERNRIILPRRGEIRDRAERLLATNREVPALAVHPAEMSPEDKNLALKVIRKAYGDPDGIMKQRILSSRPFAWLYHRMTKKDVEKFDQALEEVNGGRSIFGLRFFKEDKRFYPHKQLASNILGYTDFDMKGRIGIERQFDEELKGKVQEVKVTRDARGNTAVASLDFRLQVPSGNDVVLTIDKGFQYVTEKALNEAAVEHEPAWAVALAMNPKTGEILSLAQYPSFDPNKFNKEPIGSLRTMAVTNVIEPGSTFKVFTLAAAINNDLVKPEDMIDCRPYTVGPKTIKDSHGHEDFLSVEQIMQISSNTGAARLGGMVGLDGMYDFITAIGFGELTNIGLPGEVNGILAEKDDIIPLELATISFGQGIGATPLQLACAFSAIANGGMLMKPYIVKKISDPEGKTIQETVPEAIRKVMPREKAQIIIDMMKTVVTENGTATRANIHGCEVAGKTGTSQKLTRNRESLRRSQVTGERARKYYTSVFGGFFPADDAEVMILVIIDEPSKGKYYGGEVAAPVFREIAFEIGQMTGVCAKPPEEIAEAAL